MKSLFTTTREAKAAGYHSRRHRTRVAQDEARQRYFDRRREKIKRADRQAMLGANVKETRP